MFLVWLLCVLAVRSMLWMVTWSFQFAPPSIPLSFSRDFLMMVYPNGTYHQEIGRDRHFASVTLLSSNCNFTFIVFSEAAETGTAHFVMMQLTTAKHFRHAAVNLVLRPAVYPTEITSDGRSWKSFFGACDTLRLFFPVRRSLTISKNYSEPTCRPNASISSRNLRNFIQAINHDTCGWFNYFHTRAYMGKRKRGESKKEFEHKTSRMKNFF